jgi:signal transduction histidine kinase
MKRRMTDIGGEFSLSGGASGGTLVRLSVPMPGMNAKTRT